jgi:hypothetical protein
VASFFERHGIELPNSPIKIRREAPEILRKAVWSFAMQAGLEKTTVSNILREIIPCEDFEPLRPISSMYSAWMKCDWPYVYLGIESIGIILRDLEHCSPNVFEAHLNDFFRRHGYAWKIVDCRVEIRGPEAVETTVNQALKKLASEDLGTASNELHEALKDLSRKPEPDITGAIQHAGAALECVAKEISGDPKKTFGAILNDNPTMFPKPLDDAAHKIWGFLSNNGRHIAEGVKPEHDVAFLVTGFVAALAAYLSDKRVRSKPQR